MDLKEKRILVTGASGFIGSHLCPALRERGARVLGLSKTGGSGKQPGLEGHEVDITDRTRVGELVKKVQPHIVVHMAGTKNRSLDIDEYHAGYEINLFGSLNVIEACLGLESLSRFVFLGSCEEYGQQAVPFKESLPAAPVSAYGVAKLAVTQLVQALHRAHGFSAAILRPSIVYGPGQDADMFVPALILSLLSGKKFSMTPGEQTRDFLYVQDLVDAILLTLSAPAVAGRVINVSSATPVTIKTLALTIARLIGKRAENLIAMGGRDYRPGEAMQYWADNALARDLLGWAPQVPLEEGVRRTIAHFSERKLNP